MNDTFIVREDVYEFKHLPGSTPSTYWEDVSTVIADTEAQERSPSPKGLPTIQAESRAKCHTPGRCGDSPIQSPVFPQLAEAKANQPSTSRPKDITQIHNFFEKPKTETTQIRLMDKLKQTRPIHRGLIEAVQEPSPWKLEKKRRVENAICRVNNNYVVNPRTYQEPDINDRVDSEFMPTPPTGPKPKVRKNNRVILHPEQMLRERNLRRGEFAPRTSTEHTQDSCYSRAASHAPHPPSRPAPFLAFEATEDPCNTRAQKRFHTQYDTDIPSYEISHDDRSTACMPDTDESERLQAWSFERSQQITQERIQQEYVDELRMEDKEEPTSSQAEIDLDIKRQQLLAKKKSEKRRRRKRSEFMAATRIDDEEEFQVPNRIEYKDDTQVFVPAPPSVNNTANESYSKKKRQLRQEYANSAFMTTHDLMATASQIESGRGMQPHAPAPPTTSKEYSDSYSKKNRHFRQEYEQSEYGRTYLADASQIDYRSDMQPHVPAPPSTSYDTSDLHNRITQQLRQDYRQLPYRTNPECTSTASHIEHVSGIQPVQLTTSYDTSDIYFKRIQHYGQEYSQLAYGTNSDYKTDVNHIEQRSNMQPHVPAQPSTSYNTSDLHSRITQHHQQEYTHSTFGTTSELITGISSTIQDNQATDDSKQSQTRRSNLLSHGPVIRVEPQLTWNTSAAKRGLGFKSKLRREQEEAALHNFSHQDDNEAPKKPGVPETKLSEETRRKWKNKTFYT